MLLDISDFMLQFVAGQDYCSCEGTQSRERIVYDTKFFVNFLQVKTRTVIVH